MELGMVVYQQAAFAKFQMVALILDSGVVVPF